MTNPYVEYYTNQAGSGLTPFQGYQYQRGHGFFNSLFQNILKPLGRYLGRQALSTGVNIGNDILQGEDLKDSLKKNAKITGKKLFSDTIERAQKFAQTGSGKRRRRRKKKKKSINISPKPIKRRVTKRKKSVSKKKTKRKGPKKTKSKFTSLF